MEKERKIAVFIDFDNIKLGLDSKKVPFDIHILLDYLKSKGQIVMIKAYADWDKLTIISEDEFNTKSKIKEEAFKKLSEIKEYKARNQKKYNINRDFKKSLDKIRIKKSKEIKRIKRELVEHGADIVDMPSRKSGKNFSDIQLVVDCLEISITNKTLNTIAIVSGDSDMTPLIKKLKSYGFEVIVIGVDHTMSKMFATVSDVFRYYKYLDLKSITPAKMIESPYLSLCKAVALTKMITGSDVINKNFLSNRYKMLFPKAFEDGNYFVDLIHIASKQELIKYEDLGQGKIKILEECSHLLPPLSSFIANINYTSVKELSQYKVSYETLMAEHMRNSEELSKYFSDFVQDIICYSVFSDKTPEIIMKQFLLVEPNTENAKQIGKLFFDSIDNLERNNIIIFNEQEKVYVPCRFDRDEKQLYQTRQIERLEKSLNISEEENKQLSRKVKQYKKQDDLYKAMMEAIKLVETQNDVDNAITVLEEASSVPQYSKIAKIYLGKAYMREGRYTDTIEIYKDLLNSNIEFPALFNVLGIAYIKTGDYKSALENFEISLIKSNNQPKIIQYVNELSKYFSTDKMISSY